MHEPFQRNRLGVFGNLMKLFHKRPVEDLYEWLEIATKKLAPPARARVKLEIEAHYAEAVAAHRAAGSLEYASQAEALAELGDAKEAARNFQKRHLTAREFKAVEGMLKSARMFSDLLGGYFFFAMLSFSELLQPAHGSQLYRFALPFAYFWFFAALPTSAFFLARRKTGSSVIRSLVLTQSIGGFVGVIAGNMLLVFGGYASYLWPAVGFSIWFLMTVLSQLRLWNKLGNVPEVWDEMPPENTAAS